MFEDTLARYEWHRSRLARIQRLLARCRGATVDTGYIEGLQTQQTRALRRVRIIEEELRTEFQGARPSVACSDSDSVPEPFS